MEESVRRACRARSRFSPGSEISALGSEGSISAAYLSGVRKVIESPNFSAISSPRKVSLKLPTLTLKD